MCVCVWTSVKVFQSLRKSLKVSENLWKSVKVWRRAVQCWCACVCVSELWLPGASFWWDPFLEEWPERMSVCVCVFHQKENMTSSERWIKHWKVSSYNGKYDRLESPWVRIVLAWKHEFSLSLLKDFESFKKVALVSILRSWSFGQFHEVYITVEVRLLWKNQQSQQQLAE